MKFASVKWIPVLMGAVAINCAVIRAQDLSNEPDREKAFYNMTKLAPAQFSKGELDAAQSTAEALLKEAPNWEKNWNYGNAVHTANIVLGRVALRRGNVEEAKEFLMAAGETPGSPQLNTFGPDMTLARALIRRGETAAVLQYFDLCEKFWKMHSDKLDKWRGTVKAGQMPEFGANLRYVGF